MKTTSILALCFFLFDCAGMAENEPASLIEFSGSTSDETYSTNQLQGFRVAVSQFAAEAKCKVIPQVPRPQFPDVPDNVSTAIVALCKAHDTNAIADIASVLVRYATAQEPHGTGAYLDRKHPLVEAFMSAMKPVLPGDEIVSSSLTDWIIANRKKMGHSAVLDKEIKEYGKMKKRLQIKYERLAEEGLRMLEKKPVPAKP